jgi:hypothetical protein
MTALVVLLTVVVGFLALLVAGLLRSHADILKALHDLGAATDPDHDHVHEQTAGARRFETQPGVPEPREGGLRAFDIGGVDPFGAAASAAISGTDRLTLVAFLSSSCLTCRTFWEALGDPRTEIPGGARLVIVAKGPEAESESALRKLAPTSVTTILSSQAWLDYEIPVAPYFVLVDGARDAIVGEGAATTWDQVRNLMGQALADAGIAAERGRIVTAGPRARAAHLSGAERERRIDEELRAAGIEPGDPSLYDQSPASVRRSRSSGPRR